MERQGRRTASIYIEGCLSLSDLKIASTHVLVLS